VKLEAVYPASQADVWEALTDPRAIADWLMDNDFRPVVGHRFTFTTRPRPGFNGIVDCKVLAVEPERRLVYSWDTGPHRTTVTWTLEPHGQGTRVTLLHEGFRGAVGILPQLILSNGWGSILRRGLPSRLGIVAAGSGRHG
jgi:uncharacterized protein YndB with AHSA1/START domain